MLKFLLLAKRIFHQRALNHSIEMTPTGTRETCDSMITGKILPLSQTGLENLSELKLGWLISEAG